MGLVPIVSVSKVIKTMVRERCYNNPPELEFFILNHGF
jgi:hypothetical protein